MSEDTNDVAMIYMEDLIASMIVMMRERYVNDIWEF